MAFYKFKPVPQENINNAVLYMRYSDTKQTENSIDGQLRVCTDYAKQHGYNIIGSYIDRAHTATNDNRPEFLRMIEDAKKQQFAFVLVYRFDRFARNRFDSAIYKRQLEQVGVKVISASEHVGDGDEGIILESIYEAMDEAYSRRLSVITKRGIREAALKGQWTGGFLPLGYDVVDKFVVVNEAEAETVKLIFREYASGTSKGQLAKLLNDKGLKTKNGKPFVFNSFTSMLANKMYIGNNNVGDIERSCPRIIDDELFQKVQAILEKNKKTRGHTVSEVHFPLSGKLFCGLCGTAMIGDSGTSSSGEKHYYYTCGNKKRTRTCKKKSERKDFLDWYVCEQTLQNVLTPDKINVVAKDVGTIVKDEYHSASSTISEIEKQLKEINAEFEKCADALINTTSATMINVINKKADSLEKRKVDLETELAKQKLAAEAMPTQQDVVTFLTSLSKGNLLDEEYRNKLISTFVNSVFLFDDKIVIYYNIKGSKQVSYVDVLNDLDQMAEGSDSFDVGTPGENRTHD